MKKLIEPVLISIVVCLLFLTFQQINFQPAQRVRTFATLAAVTNLYAEYEPDPILSPGKVDPNLTFQTLSAPGFTTKTDRNVPASEKKKVYAEYHILTHKPGDYEIDHIVALELGGSNDIENLWPESYHGLWNAHIKDRLENKLNSMVKKNQIPLEQAQYEISHDWVSAYKKYVNPLSDGTN